MPKLKHCPNCDTRLRVGSMFEVSLMSPEETKKINAYLGANKEAYCGKCGPQLLAEANGAEPKEPTEAEIDNYLHENLHLIPMVTIHQPPLWRFEVLEIVSGNCTLGTGFFTDWEASASDFWGMESNNYNEKFHIAEERAKSRARMRCIQLGGNAIVGAQLDYSEVGAAKAMAMVAVTGTAVKLKELDTLYSEERIKKMDELIETANEFIKTRFYRD